MSSGIPKLLKLRTRMAALKKEREQVMREELPLDTEVVYLRGQTEITAVVVGHHFMGDALKVRGKTSTYWLDVDRVIRARRPLDTEETDQNAEA
jgi:hypothetical protein